MVKPLENLSEGELNQRAKLHNKVKGNYPLSAENKRQLNISEEIKTAGQLFYRKNKPESTDLNYLLNTDER